jgi:formylglycine-generating enzyme required for sulfatase activity
MFVPPLRPLLSCLLAAAATVLLSPSYLAAQSAATNANAASETDTKAHESSLGQRFVAIPGTTVQFATFETRVQDFKAFTQATNHAWNFTPHFPQEADHPAVGVNLLDALAFCNWLTETERAAGKLNSAQLYRLPSDTEWSAAAGVARARRPGAPLTAEETLGDQRRFPWGLMWPPPTGAGNLAEGDIPNYSDPYRHTAPVGQFSASADGLFDLTGNVWEWTSEPDLKSTGTGHLRGGSWAYFNEETLRSSYLYEVPPELRAATVGFRLVFEDRQRTARLIAESKTLKEAELEALRAQRLTAMQTGATPEEVLAMQKRIAGSLSSPTTDALPDPATLTPAQAGVTHTNSLGMTLRPLPGGKTLLGQTEVTARQYELFLQATNQTWADKPAHIATPDHPVAGIPWVTASAFCDWLTRSQQAAGLIPASARYRLPSDAEWSAAAGLDDESGADPEARSGQNTEHFPWTPATAWPPPLRAANLDAPKIPGFDDAHAYTCAVALNNTNERGFYELGGNVAEWCADPWPSAPDDRIFRGGSWLSSERSELLTSKRNHAPKEAARGNVGFRCALELTTAP